MEKQLVKDISTVLDETRTLDGAEACKRLTDYCNHVQDQAFEDAKSLLNDVRWYKSQNSNTLKRGRNPETGEVLDELKEVKPLEVTLDASGYVLWSGGALGAQPRDLGRGGADKPSSS